MKIDKELYYYYSSEKAKESGYYTLILHNGEKVSFTSSYKDERLLSYDDDIVFVRKVKKSEVKIISTYGINDFLGKKLQEEKEIKKDLLLYKEESAMIPNINTYTQIDTMHKKNLPENFLLENIKTVEKKIEESRIGMNALEDNNSIFFIKFKKK